MDLPEITIREFRTGDYDDVVGLWCRAGLHVGASDTIPEIQKVIDRDPALFLVLEAGGRVVGAVLGAWNGRRAWVYHLAVDPGYRGGGYGSMLMDELERRFRERGALRISLLVYSDNMEAMKFYNERGWKHAPDLEYFFKDL